MSKKAGTAKSGWILKQDDATGTFVRLFGIVRSHDFMLFNNDMRDDDPVLVCPLTDADIWSPDPSKVSKRFAVEIQTRPSTDSTAASAGVGTSGARSIIFCGENKDDQEAWLQALYAASSSEEWPGGVDLAKKPQPLLYSLYLVHRATEPKTAVPAASPVSRLPALKAVPSWQRKGMLLKKLRLCSVIFDGNDPAKHPEEREIKRNTLLEIVDAVESSARQLFSDMRLLDDTFIMIRMNLFRPLPKAPPPNGDPEEEEEPFSDPQWPHLSIVYEILLRLVCTEQLDLTLKKKVVDASLVRQLLTLFDSEDMRERDYLKTITHRIYSKLTLRRALIRRVICNVFLEFIFETEVHNGVAQMLEILASIINGFAVPIKDEHKAMLVKALIPLHKAKNIIPYHPHLSYCMALYAAKDHALTKDIILGLLRFWPFGNSQKQMLFLNELEDLFEYVQESDATDFREPLSLRLAKCIGGLHFQVAERALLLWQSERFCSIMLDSNEHRPVVLSIIFPALYLNQESHWHESIRIGSQRVLEQYMEVDPPLFESFRQQMEAQSTSPVAQQIPPPPSPEPELDLGGSPTARHPKEVATPGAGAAPSQRTTVGSPVSHNPLAAFSPPHITSPATSPAAHGHPHRAPAVRSSTGFSSMPDADLLPGSHGKHKAREIVLPSSMPGDGADSRDE